MANPREPECVPQWVWLQSSAPLSTAGSLQDPGRQASRSELGSSGQHPHLSPPLAELANSLDPHKRPGAAGTASEGPTSPPLSPPLSPCSRCPALLSLKAGGGAVLAPQSPHVPSAAWEGGLGAGKGPGGGDL